MTVKKDKNNGQWKATVCWTDHARHPDRPCRQARRWFGRKSDAEAWEQSKKLEIGLMRRPMTTDEYIDITHAFRLLPPGMTLTEAVTIAAHATTDAIKHKLSVREAVKVYQDEKSAALTRSESLKGVRQKTNILVKYLGDMPISDVTAKHLIGILKDRNIQGETRNNYRRNWRTFFNWCVKASLITASPAEAITIVHTDEKMPEIFTPETVKEIFEVIAENASLQCLKHYMAVAFFTGIRPFEILRLDASQIDKKARTITITGKDAKRRSQGYIDMHDNLLAWLSDMPSHGPVFQYSEATLKRRRTELLKEINMTWPPDVARHSYASHLYALKKDAGYVRFQLRHDCDDTLFKHYRALVREKEGARYFDIYP